MANLTFSEKQLIESVFGMSGGSFIDLSNRDFKSFMKDVVSYDIYIRYPNLSKAKMFREFLKDETDIYVGKAIILSLSYMKDKKLIKDNILEESIKLQEFGERLLGRKMKCAQKESSKSTSQKSIDYDMLMTALLNIDKETTNQQSRGYAFEKFLNLLFNTFELNPRASYKTDNDQIDGSFILDGNTVLVEAKYRTSKIPKNDLILFTNKIESKSHFPKGLFVTLSSVEDRALEYFIDASARFVILTVEEIFLLCQNKVPLSKILQAKFRILDEQGIIFKHVHYLF